MTTKKILGFALGAAFICAAIPQTAAADRLSIFDDSWTMFADDDTDGDIGHVYPGYGGQAFDAEYLFYKTEGTELFIGLQTGFNLEAEWVESGNKKYYAGDLALSFDGDSSFYEYAVDFGEYTEDYQGDKVGGNSGEAGKDNEGLYSVEDGDWNEDVYFTSSNPFAMELGDIVLNSGLVVDPAGHGIAGGLTSYYRIISFDMASIAPIVRLDAHWTMSCGNDVVEGSTSVPEPSAMLLFGTGLIGLAGIARRKKM